MKTSAIALGLLASGLIGQNAAAQNSGPYTLTKEIPVAGDTGWDYLAADPASHRLFISHGSKVVVFSTATDTVAGEIPDTPGVHGIAFAPDLGRVYTSNGRENKVSVVDAASLKLIGKLDAGENPDCILFEAGRGEVYAFNGRSQSATVFTASTGKIAATIPMGGKPEFAQADPVAGRVYDNVEDKNEVAAIDTASHSIVGRWSVSPGDEPSGLAIDLEHHRLFAGCGNKMLVVLDSASGRVVATIPAGEGIDAAAFDPGTQLAFTSNGRDGTVTVVHEDTPDKYTVIQTLKTEPSARTMTVDLVTHKLYLISAKFDTAAAVPGKRPPLVPGSVRLLVCGLADGFGAK